MAKRILVYLEFMFMKHYAPNRLKLSIEGIVKMGVRPGERGWLVARLRVRSGGQGGSEPRIELIVKMQQKTSEGRSGGGGGGGRVVVNQESK